MSVLAAINVYLREHESITSLIGSRVFAYVRPQGQPLPCIILTEVTTDHANNFSGLSGWKSTQLQVDMYSESLEQVNYLANKVRVILSKPDDFTVITDVGEVQIDGISLVADNTDVVKPEAGKQAHIFRVSYTFSISAYETLPTEEIY